VAILSFDGLELDEAPKDVLPVCPHCKAELDRLWYKTEGVGGIGEKQLLICPHCRALLGYGLWRT
jgi:hypothetical protein